MRFIAIQEECVQTLQSQLVASHANTEELQERISNLEAMVWTMTDEHVCE